MFLRLFHGNCGTLDFSGLKTGQHMLGSQSSFLYGFEAYAGEQIEFYTQLGLKS